MSDTERLNLRDLDLASLRAAVGRYGVDEVRAGRISLRSTGMEPPRSRAWRVWGARHAGRWNATWSFRTCR